MCVYRHRGEGGGEDETHGDDNIYKPLRLEPTKSLAMLSMVPPSDERRLGIRRVGGRDGKRHWAREIMSSIHPGEDALTADIFLPPTDKRGFECRLPHHTATTVSWARSKKRCSDLAACPIISSKWQVRGRLLIGLSYRLRNRTPESNLHQCKANTIVRLTSGLPRSDSPDFWKSARKICLPQTFLSQNHHPLPSSKKKGNAVGCLLLGVSKKKRDAGRKK